MTMPPTPLKELSDIQSSCPHCNGTGKCENGEDKNTCDMCLIRLTHTGWMRLFRFKNPDSMINPKGCWCGVCFGRGRLEGVTFKIRNYFPFFFASVFFIFTFSLFLTNKNVPERLEAALTTLMGTIVGFYFGGKKDA